MDVQKHNVSHRTFLKTEFKYKAKLNEVPDIYDVQILTMKCINYRSVNVGRERNVSTNKYVLVCTYYKRGHTHRLIHAYIEHDNVKYVNKQKPIT